MGAHPGVAGPHGSRRLVGDEGPLGLQPTFWEILAWPEEPCGLAGHASWEAVSLPLRCRAPGLIRKMPGCGPSSQTLCHESPTLGLLHRPLLSPSQTGSDSEGTGPLGSLLGARECFQKGQASLKTGRCAARESWLWQGASPRPPETPDGLSPFGPGRLWIQASFLPSPGMDGLAGENDIRVGNWVASLSTSPQRLPQALQLTHIQPRAGDPPAQQDLPSWRTACEMGHPQGPHSPWS